MCSVLLVGKMTIREGPNAHFPNNNGKTFPDLYLNISNFPDHLIMLVLTNAAKMVGGNSDLDIRVFFDALGFVLFEDTASEVKHCDRYSHSLL